MLESKVVQTPAHGRLQRVSVLCVCVCLSIHITISFKKLTWGLHILLWMEDTRDFQFPFMFVAAGCFAFIVNTVSSSVYLLMSDFPAVWRRRRWKFAVWKRLTVGADGLNILAAAAFLTAAAATAHNPEKSLRRNLWEFDYQSSSSFYIYSLFISRWYVVWVV